MKPGIYDNISNHDYHNDPECDALSAGGIKSLLQSPAHFRASQMNNGQTPAMLFGSAAHSHILQPELGEVVALPSDLNRKSKAGQERYTAFLEQFEGCIIVSQEDREKLDDMRDALLRKEKVRAVLRGGKSEVSIFQDHPVYGFPCKCRPDLYREDIEAIFDYKTCKDASVEAFEKTVVNSGYDIQAWWYRWVNYLATGKWFSFSFIAQEKTFPYESQVFDVEDEVFDRGRRLCERAAKIYNDCIKTQIWDGYPDRVLKLGLPYWAK